MDRKQREKKIMELSQELLELREKYLKGKIDVGLWRGERYAISKLIRELQEDGN